MRISHVSTFPPTRCGIARFAADLITATDEHTHTQFALHNGEGTWGYNVHRVEEVARLGADVAASNCELVCIQHEFGIWGGREGEHLLSFLESVRSPIVSILHTTFSGAGRSASQCHILRTLISRSAKVAVFSSRAIDSLAQLCDGALTHAMVIPHGVPEVAPKRPGMWTSDENVARGPFKIVTPGFLRPDKGIEIVMEAVRILRERHLSVSYTIAGGAQPQYRGQMKYREQLVRLRGEYGLLDVVRMIPDFLPVQRQCAVVQNAHAGVFAYQDPSHASSGTVPLVLGCGRPVVCTPFEYAQAIAAGAGEVTLANGWDAQAVADGIASLMRRPDFNSIATGAYECSRSWRWGTIGAMYSTLFEEALRAAHAQPE